LSIAQRITEKLQIQKSTGQSAYLQAFSVNINTPSDIRRFTTFSRKKTVGQRSNGTHGQNIAPIFSAVAF